MFLHHSAKSRTSQWSLSLVGHSLGAHATGFTGKWMQNVTYIENRLFGKFIQFNAITIFLDSYIQQYWSCGFFMHWICIYKSLGHFDFYLNGGSIGIFALQICTHQTDLNTCSSPIFASKTWNSPRIYYFEPLPLKASNPFMSDRINIIFQTKKSHS